MPSTTETSSSEWILHKSSSVAFSPWDEGALLQQDSPKFWEPVDNPAKLCAQKQADRPELVSWGNGHFVSWGPGPGISSGSQSGSNAARKQAGWPTQAYERPRTRGADAGKYDCLTLHIHSNTNVCHVPLLLIGRAFFAQPPMQ